MNRFAPLLLAATVALSAPAAAPAADAPVAPSSDNLAAATQPVSDNTTWADRYHTRVERDLFATVAWFDRFFGDERIADEALPESSLRWTNDFRWDETDRFQYRTRVRAWVRLPRLSRKWRLVVSGETRGDPTAVKPEDPGNPGLDVASPSRRGSTELVYDLFRTARTTVDFGAGVRVKIPPDAFVRTRLQHARRLGFDTLGRITVTPYWDARDGLGESNQIDFERRLAEPTMLRWSNSLGFTVRSHAWSWGSELSLLHRLSERSAVTFGAGATGPASPAVSVQNYRTYTRYRRNFLRSWLFYELEPDVNWPKQADGGRKTVWGGTFRLEMLFLGARP
jgi:hypothetical protein